MLAVAQPADREVQQGAIADTIACEIERLRASPPTWRGRGRDHTFTLADAMVLTRKNAESVAIAAALRRRQTSARILGGASPDDGSASSEPLPFPAAKPRSNRSAASWLRDLAVGAPSTTTISRRPE